jgi:pimeloyl-ACP methyl ester carboxylesterase
MDLSVAVADDVELHIRHRPGTAPPAFLLVHGVASNARLWDGVADHLAAAGHPVYAIDLRGHGESAGPEDDGDATATATADLAAVCAHFDLTGAIVAGHSWGGNVAVRLAATHPALVAGLVLIDGGWIDPSAVYGSWQEYADTLRMPDLNGVTIDGVRGYLRAVHPDWSATAIEATLANMREEPDGSLAQRLTVPRHLAILQSMWDEPPNRWWAEVTAPARLLPAIPKGVDRRWAERIRSRVTAAATTLPRATVHEYPDSDHDLHAQRPEQVAGELLDLAREATSSATGR